MPQTTTVPQQRSFRSMAEEHSRNCSRLSEIADLCEAESRDMTEAEQAEARQLERRNNVLIMRMQAQQGRQPSLVDRERQLRDNLRNRVDTEIVFFREGDPVFNSTADMANTGIIPVQQQEMLQPLRAGLIWDKVGLPVMTGLQGQLRWPTHGKAKAYFRREGARAVDVKIDFNKLTMDGEPITCSIDVTNEAIDSSGGIIESVVRQELPAAIVDLVNATIFDTTGKMVNSAGATVDRSVLGPFVGCPRFDFEGDVPTRRELIGMKKSLYKAGIDIKHPCWVMTEDLKADLEDTKVDAGSGRFLCENDTILGWPVFCTSEIGAGNVGLGDWGYQPVGFFGQTRLVVDPYTLSKNNETSFILHQKFGTTTLRSEAFLLGRKKPAVTNP